MCLSVLQDHFTAYRFSIAHRILLSFSFLSFNTFVVHFLNSTHSQSHSHSATSFSAIFVCNCTVIKEGVKELAKVAVLEHFTYFCFSATVTTSTVLGLAVKSLCFSVLMMMFFFSFSSVLCKCTTSDAHFGSLTSDVYFYCCR